MRIRRLLAAALLVGGVLFAMASSAGADPSVDANKELKDCVEQALKGPIKDLKNSIDDCHKAKSIVVPATSELLWGSIAFLIVAGVLIKFAFPVLKKTMADRTEKIRSDLDGAASAKAQAEEELATYRAQLANSRNEGQQLIEAARADAERVRADLIARAEAEAAEIKARATDDIRLATERAQADLQASVKDLSIELAEKVVERNLDPETQRALIDSYISQVGSN
jgi:F-type H+-transporting ATPase subunit b